MAVSGGSGSIIGIGILQIVVGILLLVNGMNDLNDQQYIDWVVAPQILIVTGIVSIVTGISGFAFAGRPIKGTFGFYLFISFACFVLSLVYVIIAGSQFFAYYGFLLLIFTIVGFSISFNVYKRANQDAASYQRFDHPQQYQGQPPPNPNYQAPPMNYQGGQGYAQPPQYIYQGNPVQQQPNYQPVIQQPGPPLIQQQQGPPPQQYQNYNTTTATNSDTNPPS